MKAIVERETDNGIIKATITIDRDFRDSRVIFRLYYPRTVEPHYYIPNRVFKGAIDVINHIIENLETNGLRVEVEPLKEMDSY